MLQDENLGVAENPEALTDEEIDCRRARALTPRQAAILEFIQRSSADNGYPPTLREIGAAFGIRSTNGVNDHLRALEKKGAIKRHGYISRGVLPVAPAEKSEPSAVLPMRQMETIMRLAWRVHFRGETGLAPKLRAALASAYGENEAFAKLIEGGR